MIAPQELGVFHQGVLCQLFVEELVDVGIEAVPKLEKTPRKRFQHRYSKHTRGLTLGLTNQSSIYLNVQRGEVAVQLFLVVDVGLAADGTHHVSDVSVSHGDGEVHAEALVTHRALTGSQRLHLRQKIKIES